MISNKILIIILICFFSSCSSIPSLSKIEGSYSDQNEKAEIYKQANFLVASMASASRKLHDIAWPIMKANVDVCINSRINAFGFMVADPNDLQSSLKPSFLSASPNVLEDDNGSPNLPMIVSVANGSPANNVNIMEGDFIVSIDNELVNYKNYKNLLIQAAKQGILKIGVKRLNKNLVYSLNSELTCGYPVQPMVSHIPNAYADGSKIYITIATLDFIKDDQEIAFLISHELAHNIVHYNGKGLQEIEAKPISINDTPSLQSVGDLFIFQSGAKETEADLLGIEYAIKAGIPQDKVANYFRRISIYMPQLMDQSIFRMHPGNAKRVADIERKLEILNYKYNN